MSFWNFLGELALLKWLFGTSKPNKVSAPPPFRLHDYGHEDEYLDNIHSLENRIHKLRQQQDRCNILSDKYDELQDRIDDLQDEMDELDEMDNYFDDDLFHHR